MTSPLSRLSTGGLSRGSVHDDPSVTAPGEGPVRRGPPARLAAPGTGGGARRDDPTGSAPGAGAVRPDPPLARSMFASDPADISSDGQEALRRALARESETSATRPLAPGTVPPANTTGSPDPAPGPGPRLRVEGDLRTTGGQQVQVAGDGQLRVIGEGTVHVSGRGTLTLKGEGTVELQGRAHLHVQGDATISLQDGVVPDRTHLRVGTSLEGVQADKKPLAPLEGTQDEPRRATDEKIDWKRIGHELRAARLRELWQQAEETLRSPRARDETRGHGWAFGRQEDSGRGLQLGRRDEAPARPPIVPPGLELGQGGRRLGPRGEVARD